MAKTPSPKIHSGVPAARKVALGAYIEQLTPSGMSPDQTRAAALLVQSGKAGYPAGTK